MGDDLFKSWLVPVPTASAEIRIYKENGSRDAYASTFTDLLVDHFVGHATVASAGGYEKAAKVIANSLPTNKRIRSGDLGELLATEYLNAQTRYQVPIKKLRWKDDQDTAMRGNDVVGIDSSGRMPRLVKVEAKSRAKLNAATVQEAAQGLDANNGEPKPATLAFITKRLLEAGRDAEARVFVALQADGALGVRSIEHLVFTLSGNDPQSILSGTPAPLRKGIRRGCAAVVVADHAAFIAEVFERYGKKP